MPSTSDDKCYSVYADVGLCACMQAAFCKHQALMHKAHGRAFNSAPLLSKEGQHDLRKVALGDRSLSIGSFQGLHETAAQPADTAYMDTIPDCLDGPEAATTQMQHGLPRSSEGSPAQLVSQVRVTCL